MFKKEDYMKQDIFWCKKCLAASTRPRVTFDSRGWCNACVWAETKAKIDWKEREVELKKLLDKFRGKNKEFDVVVPVSGGKDGSYIAYNLKHKYGMNPLCVTVNPHLPSEVGVLNLKNFSASGYDLVSITPDYNLLRDLNKYGFFKMGMGYWGWLLAIFTIPPIIADKFNIPLVFYAEDGEVEYGGKKESSNTYLFDANYIKKIYVEDGYEKILNDKYFQKFNLDFFSFPKFKNDIKLTHWSYFENWDPYRNYLVAKKNCGLIDSEHNNEGTFTNFAQNDQILCDLHYYLMYLKFGFGRSTQDASIEIRRGAMSRDQAINLVKLFDGKYPESSIMKIINYYGIKKKDFNENVDKWVNKKLFQKNLDTKIWEPRFEIK